MSETSNKTFDLASLRQKLSLRAQNGNHFWRSLEEVADTAEFRAFVEAEFPSQAQNLFDAVERRQFLKLMGASLALAGASGCTRQPEEKIYPYVEAPENLVPGKPLFYATAMPLGGVAAPLLVESHLGRPTKIEGNAGHPASGGATDAFSQAAILGLYDPDRSRTIRNAGNIRPWSAFVSEIATAMDEQRRRDGAGLRLLTGTVTSPSLAHQIERLLADLPEARWIQYEPVTRDTARMAARLAFGRELNVRYRLDRATTVLALDADFLACGPGALRYARDFAAARRKGENRLYAVEPNPTNTGAAADHRLPLDAHLVEELALALAAELGVPVRPAVDVDAHREWIRAVARDLERGGRRSLVTAGEWQSVTTQLVAHAINDRLGAVGHTVEYTESIEAPGPSGLSALRELVASIDAGEIDLLIVAGVNPVYDAPADLRFGENMQKVGTRVHLGLYDDETAEQCHWHIPEAHFLESWGDARAYDGSVTIIQPLIAPLYEGKTLHELIAALAGDAAAAGASGYEAVRAYWGEQLPEPFEQNWRRAVHDGFVTGSGLPAITPNWLSPPGTQLPPRRERAQSGEWQVVLRPDPSTYDGRFANNGWLQELPRPITRLTWDNAVWMAPAAAARLGVTNGDIVELARGEQRVRGPVWIVPGQAPQTLTVHLGYGRRRAGYVAADAGFDAVPLRTSDEPWMLSGVALEATSENHVLACTQDHSSMEGRDLVRFVDGDAAHGEGHAEGGHGAHGDSYDTSLFPPVQYDGYAWGMSIDLGACIGCNACVISCQAENNIPVVGKAQVEVGREMHWLRIDRYFEGDIDEPRIVHQPVPCMHCEQAPCEIVCPVNATVHSDEGLNDMVYNRCVGTRYCSNNCPYKVRRFNFLLYNDVRSDVLKMAANPDVTVRSRGVMEKCTYCVQRISQARITAKREGREIRDGEVVTACQAVCPTEAIVFGDINDPKSRVSQLKKSPRDYSLLAELGTKPRTTYLAGVRNPNPALTAVEKKQV